MIRHLRHGLANLTAQLIHPLGKAERIRRVGPLIPDVGDDALADIDGDPARFEEQTWLYRATRASLRHNSIFSWRLSGTSIVRT